MSGHHRASCAPVPNGDTRPHAPSGRPASYEDLKALPDGQVGELLADELFVSSGPTARHAVASSVLSAELRGASQSGRFGPGGCWIIDEPELHLEADVLVSDLEGWRKERMPEMPDAPVFEIVPDWVCEILSLSTARLDLERKLPRYAQAGVRHAWIINPLVKAVEIFRLEGSN